MRGLVWRCVGGSGCGNGDGYQRAQQDVRLAGSVGGWGDVHGVEMMRFPVRWESAVSRQRPRTWRER